MPKKRTLATACNGEYSGEVVSINGDTVRLELFDAVMMVGCAMASLSGQERDFKKSDVRFWANEESMMLEVFSCLKSRGLLKDRDTN